jgi:hypothetical protein
MNKKRREVYEFRETESWVTHTLGERATRERNEPDVAGREGSNQLLRDGYQ